jgi:tetratricopeptide (TPR) repeat protein
VAATAVANMCDAGPPPRRWGFVIPAVILLALVTGRLVSLLPHDRKPVLDDLYARASRAYAEARYQDAAEYARHALAQGADPGTQAELHCLRAESLSRAGRPWDAVASFMAAYEEQSAGPHVAQALFGEAAAREAAGDAKGAAAARERLRRDFPGTPWAARLQQSP